VGEVDGSADVHTDGQIGAGVVKMDAGVQSAADGGGV